MKKYIIKGECTPKARAKFNRYGGTYGKAFVRQQKYENHVKDSLIEQGAKEMSGALFMKIDIYKPFLKGWTKKQVREAEQGKILAVKRPDIDNYVKSIVDGAEGYLYADDSTIVSILAQKSYARDPRVEIGVIPYADIQEGLERLFRENEKIGSKIKKMRINLGETMEEFAARFNSSKGTINNWEKDRNRPNKTNLKIIAKIENITVNELLNGKNN